MSTRWTASGGGRAPRPRAPVEPRAIHGLRRERERTFRNALLLGFGISLALHLILFLIVGGFRLGRLEYQPVSEVESQEPPAGLVVIGVEGGAAPRPPDVPRTEPRPRRPEETEVVEIAPAPPTPLPEPAAREPRAEPEDIEEEATFLTNAERLRPQFNDERVWIDPTVRPLYGARLARYARADSAVRAIMSDLIESARLSEEERRKAVDWTFGEGDERWGISPEGLHLGGITIPIPFGFGLTGPNRRELEQAIRDLTEIQRQDLQADLEQNRLERAEAMRQRSAEEVRRRAGQGTAPGDSAARDTTARPDTTARRDTTARPDSSAHPDDTSGRDTPAIGRAFPS